MTITYAIIGAVVAILAWVAGSYNSLVKAKLLVESSWADIDTLLKKRFDLIPNLIETIKGYTEHEKSTLEEVVEARTKASQINIDISKATPEQMQAFQESQEELSKGLGKLFALAEAYPDLKANQSFLDLQSQLQQIETEINMGRRMYNGAVRKFNELVQMFPSNIIANIFGFANKKFFEIENKEERENVKVKF